MATVRVMFMLRVKVRFRLSSGLLLELGLG
jgi:hypothetical protein